MAPGRMRKTEVLFSWGGLRLCSCLSPSLGGMSAMVFFAGGSMTFWKDDGWGCRWGRWERKMSSADLPTSAVCS